MKQSVAWWCFVPHKLAPQEFVRTVVELGYTAVDLVPPEYWPLVQEAGLGIASIDGHQSIQVGLNRRDQHARIQREIEENLALAERWGIPHLICFSGSRHGENDAVGIEVTAEGLARVARSAENAGVNLVLELLNSKVDHPGYQADHTAWGVQVCQRVNSPRVKLLYDVYHMQVMEGDVIRTIGEAQSFIAHYHTAGNPGRYDLDDSQELNYAPIFQAIRSTGYSGYIAHEFIPKGDPRRALKAAFDLCAHNI